MIAERLVGAVALVAGLTLAVPTVTEAQQQVPQEAPVQVEVTDELVDQFVSVYPEILTVAQAAQAELAVAETAEAAQAIQQDAQEQISAVLEEGDLTVEEYEAVVMRLNDDPELRAEVEERLAEQEDGGGF